LSSHSIAILRLNYGERWDNKIQLLSCMSPRPPLLDGVADQGGVAIDHVSEFSVGQRNEQPRDDA